jgi:hypothetical protein
VTLQAATLTTGDAPPFASVTAPANNTAFLAPANFDIQASATDPGGSISKVEFFQNGAKLGERTSEPYSLSWSNVGVGTYALTARATDNTGQTYTSPARMVFVTIPGGFLAGTIQSPSGPVDLTAQGAVDWTHWGYPEPHNGVMSSRYFNRKRNVPQRISNYSIAGSGSASRYADNLVAYSWSDGTPTLSVSPSTTGFYIGGVSNGFQITVPADTTPRHLRFFTGVYLGRGRLEARLSDYSAAPFIDTTISSFGKAVGAYTIDYVAASANQSLIVRYTADTLFDETYGNVTMQAAALFTPAVSGPLTLNIARGDGGVNLTFPTQPSIYYTLEGIDALGQSNWQPVTSVFGNGLDALIVQPLTSNRWYRLKAQ